MLFGFIVPHLVAARWGNSFLVKLRTSRFLAFSKGGEYPVVWSTARGNDATYLSNSLVGIKRHLPALTALIVPSAINWSSFVVPMSSARAAVFFRTANGRNSAVTSGLRSTFLSSVFIAKSSDAWGASFVWDFAPVHQSYVWCMRARDY
jgi:hypothetical protein